MAATLTELTLATSINGSSVQLPILSGTGWTSSASTLTLNPASDSTPAIYAAIITAPSGYSFSGSDSPPSYGSNSDATYVVMVADDVTTAYLIACDSLSPSSPSQNNTLTLSLTNGSSTASLAATVQFQ